MLRGQFLCHVLKALFFIKIALKLSYFCKKMENFQALGAPPPDPRTSSGWGLCPQSPIGPQTPKTAPYFEFLATRLAAVLPLRKGSAYLVILAGSGRLQPRSPHDCPYLSLIDVCYTPEIGRKFDQISVKIFFHFFFGFISIPAKN